MPTALFDSTGKVSPALAEVAHIVGLQHKGTIQSFWEASQREWYQAGKLRAEIQSPQYASLLPQLLPHFDQLGLVNAVSMFHRDHYQHALILGALITAVRKRLGNFIKECDFRGGKVEKLVMLGSRRPLIPSELDMLHNAKNAELAFDPANSMEHLPPPQTEGQMMYRVACQTFGQQYVAEKVTSLTAPAVEGRNVNTEDTIRYWLSFNPTSGDVLVVSSQPYIGFQHLIAKKLLPDRRVHTIGYEAPASTNVGQFLDTIAKTTHELLLIG